MTTGKRKINGIMFIIIIIITSVSSSSLLLPIVESEQSIQADFFDNDINSHIIQSDQLISCERKNDNAYNLERSRCNLFIEINNPHQINELQWNSHLCNLNVLELYHLLLYQHSIFNKNIN